MSAVEQIANLIRAAIFVAGSSVAFYNLGIPAIGAVIDFYETDHRIRNQNRTPEIIAEQRERAFKVVCPRYAQASTWERWTNGFYRRRSWCENYLHRLPQIEPEVQFDPVTFIAD